MIPFKSHNPQGFTRLHLNAQPFIGVGVKGLNRHRFQRVNPWRQRLDLLRRSFAANAAQISTRRSGFTLVEVLVAVLIVALVITPLFMSETNIFAHAVRLSKSLQRTFMLKQFFVDSALKMDVAKLKDKPTVEKKIDTTVPPMNFKFETKKVEKEERFKKFPDLYMQRATAEWQDGAVKRKEALVSFLMIEEPKAEKK